MHQRKPRLAVDAALAVLASARRRRLFGYLLEEADPPTNRAELAERMAANGDADLETVMASLAHRHLPRLDDAGVVEYDHRSGGVRLEETAEDLRPLLALCEEWESARG